MFGRKTSRVEISADLFLQLFGVLIDADRIPGFFDPVFHFAALQICRDLVADLINRIGEYFEIGADCLVRAFIESDLDRVRAVEQFDVIERLFRKHPLDKSDDPVFIEIIQMRDVMRQTAFRPFVLLKVLKTAAAVNHCTGHRKFGAFRPETEIITSDPQSGVSDSALNYPPRAVSGQPGNPNAYSNRYIKFSYLIFPEKTSKSELVSSILPLFLYVCFSYKKRHFHRKKMNRKKNAFRALPIGNSVARKTTSEIYSVRRVI